MSIKKTWFSYILWLFATGFSILFTYSYITGIITCYSFDQLGAFYYRIGVTAAFVIGVSLIYVFLSWIRSRIKGISIPKWGRRLFHVLVLCGMTALFIMTRYMVLFRTSLESVIPMDVYESARVMLGSGNSAMQESLFVFEDVYINILSGLFLFLGNKMEIMLYFQIFLQAATFLLLLFIGWNLQKGLLGWVPAMVYVLSPYCMDMVVHLHADNFWFFIVILCIAVMCILEKAWKNKVITYVLITLVGILFSVFSAIDAYPHVADWNSVFEFWFYEKMINGGAEGYFSFLFLMAGMIFYCISFWKTKTDNVSAYILPVTAFSVILYLDLWTDNLSTIYMLIRIYFAFMVAEGLRILFEAEPKVLTGQNADANTDTDTEPNADMNDFEWTEMKTIMEQKEEAAVESGEDDSISDSGAPVDVQEDGVPEDTGVIRVSDILKAANVEESNIPVTENSSEEDVVDKTAMIENVLPMPKKHVSRTFEYAFEPAEDMMHYDVEVENDDYDYE